MRRTAIFHKLIAWLGCLFEADRKDSPSERRGGKNRTMWG